MKRIDAIETDRYSLEIIECDCGFHIGIDATFLEQVGDTKITCPSCQSVISTKDVVIP